MIFKVRVVAIADNGQEQVHELVSLHWAELKLETLGLSLVEGKAILRGIQQVVVEHQTAHWMAAQKRCPDCGQQWYSTGHHDLPLRTVLGRITLQSLLFHHCDCQPHQSNTFSPLAALLPEHTTPELLFLETKWSALMSYGLTAELLEEVLPMDSPLHASTIREHVCSVAQRLEGMQMNQRIDFLSDGGEDVRQVQMYLNPEAEHLLDWFHVTMRLTVLMQTARGAPEKINTGEEQYDLRPEVLKQLESIKWYLWHGNVFQALNHLQDLEMDLDVAAFDSKDENTRKLLKGVGELHTYVERNQSFIPNYGERYRNGERISSGFVESTVNQVVSKRMVKRQQMQWTQRGAHLLLQVRTLVLNEDWEGTFRRWYPDSRSQTPRQQAVKAA